MSASPLPPGPSSSPLDWRKQFLERRFHDFLAAEQDEFQVAGVALSPAEALQKCKPDKYEVALTEYAQREGEEALENACGAYPAPIAIPLFRALNSADNEHERLLHFRDTAEALIVVLLSLVVSECRSKGVKLTRLTYPNPGGVQESFTGRKLITDSVAHRLAMLEGLLNGLSSHANLVCVQQIPVDAVRRLSELNGIRNDFSHYEAMTETEAAKVCQDVREQLADAVLAFELLADVELVTFVGAVTGKPGVARFELHTGSTQNKNLKERTLPSACLAKCLGITADQLSRPLFHCEGELMEATPYLHTEVNARGNRRNIWMFKRRFAQVTTIEFQIVGEREIKQIVESAATVEVAVLDELFT
jgi:hypothetical protein